MPDISALGNLNSSEPLDLSMYAEAKESTFQLPKKGEYVLTAPPTIDEKAFGATQAGFLSAQVDPIITGPTNEGFQVRYTKVSAKPFKRGDTTVSQMGDYLKACGVEGTVPGDPQSLADLVASTAGRTYRAVLDWRAYDKETGFQVEGMEKFPSDGNGGHTPFITVPGTDRQVRANIIVRRYISA